MYGGSKDMNGLYQEAMYVAEMFDIPKIIVDDYYEAFVEFVREELDKRIKKRSYTRIDTSIFMQVIMSEANII